MSKNGRLTVLPVTPARWADLEALFGPRGAAGGCWCMLWRIRRAEWEARKGSGNRTALKALVDSGAEPGLLAYDGDEAVGWCSLAPRAAFPGLERPRVLKPVDDQPVWSITCFFIRKSHRKTGLSVTLLRAACDYVRERGGRVLEGYPIEPKTAPYPQVYAWTGFAAAFTTAGFTECARRSETRPIMRRLLG